LPTLDAARHQIVLAGARFARETALQFFQYWCSTTKEAEIAEASQSQTDSQSRPA